MTKEEYLHLQHSESVVAQMSATVFAALVQKGPANFENEDALIEQAVGIAIKLANRCETLIKSDEEWVKKDRSSGFLVG